MSRRAVLLLVLLVASVSALLMRQKEPDSRFPSGANHREPISPVAQSEIHSESAAGAPANASRTIFAAGTVEGSQREVRLRFELTGRLVELAVTEGQMVRAGHVLARIDNSTYLAELSEAKATLMLARAERERLVNGSRKESREAAAAMTRSARARLEQANKQWERAESLRKGRNVAQQELDDLKANQLAAKAELDAALARQAEAEAAAREDELHMCDAKIAVADARVQQAESQLRKTELRAPTDGLILRTKGEVGEMVWPVHDDHLITMVSVTALRTRAYVEELDAFRVAPGQRVSIVADGRPDARFTGTVTSCAPYMVPKKVFSNTPGERVDVKVREVMITLDKSSYADLVIGLPVDVYFEAQGSVVARSSETANASRTRTPDRK